MPRNLSLAATLYADPKGESRLVKAIEQLKPSVITVHEEEGYASLPEDYIDKALLTASELGLDFAKIDLIAKALRMYGFEKRVAYEQQMTKPVRVFILDSNVEETESQAISVAEVSSDQIPLPFVVQEQRKFGNSIFRYLVTVKGYPLNRDTAFLADHLSSSFLSEEQREEVIRHRYKEPVQLQHLNVGKLQAEDSAIEAKIRDLWAQTQGDFLHLGSIVNIFGGYHNLFERLRDLNPKRYRLNEI